MPARVIKKYLSDQDTVHNLNLDPGRAAAAGADATTGTASNIKAKVSKGNREFGIRPRGVTLARTVGTAPDTFKKYSFLPVMTPTAYNGTGFNLGTEITIDSVAWTVVSRVPEDY